MRSTFFYSRSCSKSLAQSDQDEDVLRREPSAVIIASSRGWCLTGNSCKNISHYDEK